MVGKGRVIRSGSPRGSQIASRPSQWTHPPLCRSSAKLPVVSLGRPAVNTVRGKSVCKNNVELRLRCPDVLPDSVEVIGIGDVGSHSGDRSANFVGGDRQLNLSAACDEYNAPSATNCCAVANPNPLPLLPPVISATFPSLVLLPETCRARKNTTG